MSFLKKGFLLLSTVVFLSDSYATTNLPSNTPIVELGEPHYSIIDGNNVNMATGLLHYTLNTVSIGANSLSLSHHITINSSDVVNLEAYISGYKDKFRGGLKKTFHTREPQLNKSFEVIQVADHEGVYDFIINEAGDFEGLAGVLDTLTVADDNRHYILTKRNGQRVYFYSRTLIPNVLTPDYAAYASMVKIEEPNGYTITIHKEGTAISSKITSVNTNNGLQLKYIYDVHTRPLEASKRSATSNPLIAADSLNWSNQFPSKIIALNNAIETCPTAGNVCTVSGRWPEARFIWPDGMPRAMYIGESTFKVIDAFGTVTEFIHTAIDHFQNDPLPSLNVNNVGKHFFPRISKVKNNKGLDISYQYINKFLVGYELPILYSRGFGHRGALVKAINHGVITNYTLLDGGIEVERVQRYVLEG